MITKLLVLLVSLSVSTHSISSHSGFTISGVIKDKTTGTPIQYVHVFTVKGEEEAITNAKGEFRFETWQQSAELATEKEGYQESIVKLHLPAAKQTILLTKE